MLLCPELGQAIIACPPLVASPDTPLIEAIQLLNHTEHSENCVLIQAAGQLVGLLSERDVVRIVAQGRSPNNVTVSVAMTSPVLTISSEKATIQAALTSLEQHSTNYLVVVDQQEQPIGWVTPYRLLCALRQSQESPEPLRDPESRRSIPISALPQRRASDLQTTTPQAHLVAAISTRIRSAFNLEELLNAATTELEERRRAEEALRRSEEKFRIAFEQSPVPMSMRGLDRHYLKVNQAYCDLLGYSAEELMNLTFVDLTHPDDIDADLALDNKLTRGELCSFQLEKRLIHKAGQAISTILNVALVRDADEQPLHVIAQILDITERKQAEELLRQGEARYCALVNGIPDLLIRVHQDGTYLDFVPKNQGNLKTIAPEQLVLGKTSIYDFMPLALAQERMGYVGQALQTGEMQVYEYPLEIQGELHHEECRIIASGADEVLVMVRDITDRKQAEVALLESEARFQQAFQYAAIGMALVALDGRWLQVNHSLCEIVGYSEQELLNTNFQAITHPEDLNSDLEHLQKILAGETRFYQKEKRYIHKQGHIVWGLLNVSLVQNTQGQPLHFVSQIQDITERKWSESALQQSEERFRLLSDSSPIGIFQTDLKGRCLYTNPRWQEMTGLTYEQSLGEGWASAVHPDDQQAVIIEWQQCVNEGQEFSWEFRFLTPQGAVHWVSARATALRSETGEIIGYVGTDADISDLKQAEEALQQLNQELEQRVEHRTQELHQSRQALQQSEQFLRSIYEGLAFPIFVYDLSETGEWFCAGLNPWAEQTMGITAATATGKPLEAIFEPVLATQLRQNFTRCLDSKTAITYSECQTLQGQESWWLTTLNPLQDSSGQIYRLVGTACEITELKNAEILQRSHLAELVEWRNRYEAAQQASGQILYEWDLINNQPTWGFNTDEILGYSLSEMPYGLDEWLALVHPDDRPSFLAALEQSIAAQTPLRSEYRLRRKDESFVWVEDRNRLFADSTGEFTRVMGFIIDISERKQAEQALRSLKERQQLLLASSPAVIFSTDLSEHYPTTFLSENIANILGYSPQTVLADRNFWACHTHPDDWSYVGDRLDMLSQQPDRNASDHQTYEYRVLHHNNQYRWMREEIRLLRDKTGNPSEIVGYFADITDSKQVEDQLRQTNEQLSIANTELARATRLKDEFLANMSHELRTPLNAILGLSEGLLDEVYGLLNDKQKKSITTIERSGKHLLELINDILDLSKIESGKFELQITAVPVKSLCEASLSFVKQLALKKKIQLVLNIPENINQISADDRRMRQVLINLLSNAVKFTPEGGRVTLAVQLDPTHQQICFSVIDTGIGIAPEDLKKLFQAFVQIDSRLNRQYSGTGLGLALVRRIAELHGGSVAVESEVGKGSQFTVMLPIIEQGKLRELFLPNLPEPPHPRPHSTHSSLPLILLAEDNKINIELFSDYLEEQGYQLIFAQNGLEAVQMAQAQQPHLILMDVQMPGMDGLEATRLIRADPAFADIPIIALTALAMSGDCEKCLAAGASAYLTKPVSLKELTKVIEMLLERI
jgi:PAS domain S-box-containing protein